MEVDRRTRILVVSDLHAFVSMQGRDHKPSAMDLGPTGTGHRLIESIPQRLEDIGVHAVDLVVCPGDLADKSEEGAILEAWKALNTLATKLGSQLVASPGNHDLASRPGVGSLDPREVLVNLQPPFPMLTEASHSNFFTWHCAAIDVESVRIAAVNSCSMHGLGAEDPEFTHGRVSASTVRHLRDEIARTPRPSKNVLVIHHHPVQLPYFDTEERSQIKEAEYLLKVLEDDANWLVIHGHKHRPWLHYAHGGGGSATIFSAGSLSVDVGGGDFGAAVRNQFYLIELLGDQEANELGLAMAGTVRAWTRSPYLEEQWVEASQRDALAANSGFGWRVAPSVVAGEMSKWILGREGPIETADLYDWQPRLRYMTPNDLAALVDHVNRLGSVRVMVDEHGLLGHVEITRGAS